MSLALVLSSGQRLQLEVLAVVTGIGLVVIGYFLISFVKGAGYEPVPSGILDQMIQMSHPAKGQRVFDLGSGFGRMIIRVAKVTGARTTGVEVDPLKVWWTRRAIRSNHLEGQVDVIKANLLDADLSQADFVFAFLWEGIMQKVGDKAVREMKPGSLIVSYYHKILGWDPETQDAKKRIYLYRVPERTAVT